MSSREALKMGLSESLKSKKLRLGAGIVGVILVGFFLLKFMTSSGTDVPAEKERPATRTEKPVPKPKKEERPIQSPLFEALKELKDPFRGESPELLELENKINATKKEIELLKFSLEEKKLRQEIKDLESQMPGTVVAGTPGKVAEAESAGGVKAEAESPQLVSVRAILITDDEKSALIVSGENGSWVHEGEEFDGWRVKEIKTDRVVFLRNGKTYVFFYDRSTFREEGES
jgi:hypothetical protein